MKLKEITKNVVVNTPTEEEANELLAILHENGYAWRGGQALNSSNCWGSKKADTCYRFNKYKTAVYDDRQYYEKNGYAIISLSEFIAEYADPDASLDQIISDSADLLKEMEDEPEEKPAEEPLDLCELLRGRESEDFYSPIFGSSIFEGLNDKSPYPLHFKCGESLTCDGRFYLNGQRLLFPSRELYEKYPLDAGKAWREWQEAQLKCRIQLSVEIIGKGSTEVNGIDVVFRTAADRDKCIEEIKAIIEKHAK